MGIMRGTHVRGGLVGLIALSILASGCSNPGDPNYVKVNNGRIVVDRPAAWATDVPVEEPWTIGFRAAPGSVEQIQLSGDFGEFMSAGQGMGSLIGQAQLGLKEFTVVETRDVEVKGATNAQAVRYTMEDNTGSQLSGEWVVAARWPYPQSVAVSILSQEFDPDLERQVLESMELRPVLE